MGASLPGLKIHTWGTRNCHLSIDRWDGGIVPGLKIETWGTPFSANSANSPLRDFLGADAGHFAGVAVAAGTREFGAEIAQQVFAAAGAPFRVALHALQAPLANIFLDL